MSNPITPLPKDITHSCVFDWPDRASRPGPPPPSWVPPYPYGPSDDWNPNDPLDNGVPGSNPNPGPPSHVNVGTTGFWYWFIPDADALTYNPGSHHYQGDGVNIPTYVNVDCGLTSWTYADPNVASGGDSQHSAICQAAYANCDYRGFFNFKAMHTQNPSVAVFSGDIGIATYYNISKVFTYTFTRYAGDLTAGMTILEQSAPNYDWTFSGYTTIQNYASFTHNVTGSSSYGLTVFFHWVYTVATGYLDLTYP